MNPEETEGLCSLGCPLCTQPELTESQMLFLGQRPGEIAEGEPSAFDRLVIHPSLLEDRLSGGEEA